MKALIGKRFKRNKYGLSLWTDRILGTTIHWEVLNYKQGESVYKPIIYVFGVNANNKTCLFGGEANKYLYKLDEIVIL